MVTRRLQSGDRARQRGALHADMVVAIALLMAVALPLTVSSVNEQKLLRAEYHHAVAMGIVDGEMEILAVGEWRAWTEGAHNYPVRAEAAKNLPPGRFVLTRGANTLRLEWLPEKPAHTGKIAREIRLP
ncbi:MAG: hypothetical protein HY300_14840 [Verrucomicrobia bacterium]|nr:hypothetical protein [Verrucomicrobiota bacterium]